MPRYALPINTNTLDLATFLNDGVKPKYEERSTYLVFEIDSPREITSKIEFEDDLYDEEGNSKATMVWLVG